jgi:hypothetical protein
MSLCDERLGVRVMQVWLHSSDNAVTIVVVVSCFRSDLFLFLAGNHTTAFCGVRHIIIQ